MSGIRRVRFAATDPVVGGANLNNADNSFINSREIDIQCDHKFLGGIQRVLRTDYVLRYLKRETAEKLLESESIDYPEAVELGRQWFDMDKLFHAKQDRIAIGEIVDEIYKEIGKT